MARFRYIVTDVDQAVAFYTSILGFSLEQNFAPAVAILQREDLELVVSGPKASASRPMPDGSQPVSGGWNRIVILTEDLDKLVSKLGKRVSSFATRFCPGPAEAKSFAKTRQGIRSNSFSRRIPNSLDPIAPTIIDYCARKV